MISIALDPFTVMAEQGYLVGGRAKSKPPVGCPLWGTVIHNDGQIFRVKWDRLDEVHEYDLATEIQRHHESVMAFEAMLGPSKDPIEAALGSFGGSSNPGRAYHRPGQHPDERRARESFEHVQYGRFLG